MYTAQQIVDLFKKHNLEPVNHEYFQFKDEDNPRTLCGACAMGIIIYDKYPETILTTGFFPTNTYHNELGINDNMESGIIGGFDGASPVITLSEEEEYMNGYNLGKEVRRLCGIQ